jgi:hypothetical protein
LGRFFANVAEKNAPIPAFRRGLILEKAEQEREFSRAALFLVAVQVPQERLAGVASAGVSFGPPH